MVRHIYFEKEPGCENVVLYEFNAGLIGYNTGSIKNLRESIPLWKKINAAWQWYEEKTVPSSLLNKAKHITNETNMRKYNKYVI